MSVSASTVVLSSASTKCKNVTFTAKLNKPMPETKTKLGLVGVDVYGPDSELFAGTAFKRIGKTTKYKGSVKLCGSHDAGKYRAEIYGVVITKTNIVTTNKVKKNVFLKRPSRLTLDATPEPVVKGQRLTATGSLVVDDKALANAKVTIYFKAKGKKTFKYKGTAVTDVAGNYTKQFTASKNGTWKVEYAGNSSRNEAAATDVVKVTK
ncbi:hypothetical protein AB0F81_00340 [Actinoplanes sp. NPDC024001]|uniref:hypothetical protein n=1 Tax=Actinoplanes sp. NPDC024001 TaxID=3154598 RepID=UPI0033FFC19C